MHARQLSLLAASIFAAACASADALDFSKAQPYGAGFTREGDSIVCTSREVKLAGSAKPQKAAGAWWRIALDQASPVPVRFGAEGVADELDESAAFRLYVDVTYADGSHQWGVTESFDPALAAGWHRRDVTIRPGRPIRSLSCYLMLRGGLGKVRFRAPSFTTLPPDTRPLLDGEPADMAELPPSAGFVLRDAAAGGKWLRMDGNACAAGCSLTVKESPLGGDARAIEATVFGGAEGDRAVTLAYSVALPPGGMMWFDSPRSRIALDDKAEEQSATRIAAGKGLSIWPFGAVSAGGKGFAIGIDPDFPAVYRVTASPRLNRLSIFFDIGLAPEKRSASVRFAVFPFAAEDGFRGALERYQALYPAAHAVRAPRQGNWMAFHSISNLPHHEDFGFRFKEGTKETEWDDAHEIYTFHYEEPCTWWMKLGDAGAGAAKTTRAACAAKAEELAEKGDGTAIAWRTSAVRDARGQPYGEIRDTPWCNGIVWSLNCAPGLSGAHTEFSRKWSEAALDARYGANPPPFPQGLDGEYLDSANLPVTCAFDFDRAHFAAMRTPLSFTPGAAPRIGVFKGLMVAECVAAVARAAHARGRLAMANTTPVSSCLLAFHLDVMGIETNWKRGGAWRPMPDDELVYRRAVCGGKPFCFLQNTDFANFSYADSDRYMQRCLAYGMFPSFFSANAATGHYFSQPALYERDRPLFRKYMPAATELAEAGWRPVNRLLASDAADVVTEQFGETFATVFNLAERPVRVRLTPLRGADEARERVTGEKWELPADGMVLEMPPETCRVLQFD